MIELKIANSTALFILTERMKVELESRKRKNIFSEETTFENMSYDQLIKLIEYSLFDIVCMLPAEVLTDKNNLPQIITKAVNSLSGIFHKEELSSYSIIQAHNLIRPLEQLYSKYLENNLYLLN
ncbi:MAG: hypothetical protein CO129_07360 [Ignavibacteriales bacterium CG_4_9_14_3_um_filter_34_10]|nr:MAG: hypothetical protein CO129_07360 [Ignavibacteriales bacterium CG_4_9_14_3_um_filter_34_10]